MGFTEILALISGIVKFLPEVRKLIQLLQDTPAEKRAEITAKISSEAEKLRMTGRPTWEK